MRRLLALYNQIIAEYVRPGAAYEVNLPGALQKASCDSPEQRIALLRKARDSILTLLAFDIFPRFLQSPDYRAMLADISSNRSNPLTDKPPLEPLSPLAGGGSTLQPTTWLERFIRLADMLPVCITLAEVGVGLECITVEALLSTPPVDFPLFFRMTV